MFLDKTELLGELLYYILCFEKSRKKRGIWTKQYKTELRDSIYNCLDILRCLNDENIKNEDYICIKHCLNHPYILKLIQENNLTIDNIELTNNIHIMHSERISINNAMETILSNIINLLNASRKGYKNEISKLLQCVHNFPRFYLINNNSSLFLKNNWYLGINAIKEYARFYYNDDEINILFGC